MEITIADFKKAFNEDIRVKPYFLRDLVEPGDKLIYTIGTEMLSEVTLIIGIKILTEKQIESLYNRIWDHLDTLLELNTHTFQLYYDYLTQLLQFYLDLAEKAELYEIAENMKRLKNRFNKSE